jgi:hypothetical protein
MARKRRKEKNKRFFTIEQANKMLPLVRAIVRDIVELYRDLHERQERLERIHAAQKETASDPYREESQLAEQELTREAVRLEEYLDELRRLGVEFKGWDGLVDFPCQMDGREVSLCWKLDEPEIAHWHEVDAGFSGRQKLFVGAALGDDNAVEE